MVRHERTKYLFRAINPAKKFSQFTYQEISFGEFNAGDCVKGNILYIEGVYYMYSASSFFYVNDPAYKSFAQFKNGRTLIKTLDI